MNTNPRYMAIICPKCGSKEIAFVTEYHKCLGARISLAITATLFPLLCIFAIVLLGFYEARGIIALLGFLFGTGIITSIICIIVIESRTHVQAICRNCGNLWLLN